MNEYPDTLGSSFIGSDSANVDKYIENMYEDAWRILTKYVPKSWLTQKSFKNYPITVNSTKGTGYVILPTDYFMISSFKMLGWQVQSNTAIEETELVVRIQSNDYTRGTSLRPICTISTKDISLVPVDVKVVGEEAVEKTNLPDGKWYCTVTKKIHAFRGDSTNWKGLHAGGSYNIGDVVLFDNNGYKVYYCGVDGNTDDPTGAGWTELTEIVPSKVLYKDELYYMGSSSGLEELSLTLGICQILNYYSLPKGLTTHTVEEAFYIPLPVSLTELSDNDEIGQGAKLIEPLAYVTASCVYSSFNSELSKTILEIGINLIK